MLSFARQVKSGNGIGRRRGRRGWWFYRELKVAQRTSRYGRARFAGGAGGAVARAGRTPGPAWFEHLAAQADVASYRRRAWWSGGPAGWVQWGDDPHWVAVGQRHASRRPSPPHWLLTCPVVRHRHPSPHPPHYSYPLRHPLTYAQLLSVIFFYPIASTSVSLTLTRYCTWGSLLIFRISCIILRLLYGWTLLVPGSSPLYPALFSSQSFSTNLKGNLSKKWFCWDCLARISSPFKESLVLVESGLRCNRPNLMLIAVVGVEASQFSQSFCAIVICQRDCNCRTESWNKSSVKVVCYGCSGTGNKHH